MGAVIDLAAIRRATGVTQTELAANLGVGQAQVSKIERGGSDSSPSNQWRKSSVDITW